MSPRFTKQPPFLRDGANNGNERSTIRSVAAATAAAQRTAHPPHAYAEPDFDYPNRPIRIIVNVAPGGGVDTATRIVGEKLHARFGHPFVVENRPGGGGNIGAEVVYRAEPDGYTLLSSSPSPLAINGALYRKLSFRPEAFETIAVMTRIPNVLVVHRDFPANTLKEFIAYLKDHPDKLSYASQGIGTASHLTGELFMNRTGTKLIHMPYKGGTAGAITELVAGNVDLSFIQFSSVFDLHYAGKVKVLAIAFATRLEVFPGIPTMAEAGLPGVSSETWNAISAPPKTPPAIVLKLNRAINDVLSEPEVRARFRELQVLVSGGSLAETRRFVERERKLWGDVIRAAAVPLH